MVSPSTTRLVLIASFLIMTKLEPNNFLAATFYRSINHTFVLKKHLQSVKYQHKKQMLGAIMETMYVHVVLIIKKNNFSLSSLSGATCLLVVVSAVDRYNTGYMLYFFVVISYYVHGYTMGGFLFKDLK